MGECNLLPAFACLFDFFNVGVNRVEYTIANYVQCVILKYMCGSLDFREGEGRGGEYGAMGLYTHVFPTAGGSVY